VLLKNNAKIAPAGWQAGTAPPATLEFIGRGRDCGAALTEIVAFAPRGEIRAGWAARRGYDFVTVGPSWH
jgi:hypothetical protein